MATRNVTLKLTEHQENAIKAFFADNKWEYCVKETKKRVRKATSKKQACPMVPNVNNGNGDGPEDGHNDNDRHDECSFCLLTPCVTSVEHYFLGDGQGPCDENSSIRHAKYTNYWKVINNLGGWNNPQYLDRKKLLAGGGEWAFVHRREVMPVCVLKQVRNLYPNPPGRSYNGP